MKQKFIIETVNGGLYYQSSCEELYTTDVKWAEMFDTKVDAVNCIINNPDHFDFAIVTILEIWQTVERSNP